METQWINVNERLPDIGTMVLSYSIINNEYDVKFYDGLSLNFDFWQELPNPPTL